MATKVILGDLQQIGYANTINQLNSQIEIFHNRALSTQTRQWVADVRPRMVSQLEFRGL